MSSSEFPNATGSGLTRDDPRLRRAARVLLLDPAQRILLLLAHPRPDRPVWITPGGGLESGEAFEAAARRELAEEVGLVDWPLGPCVWQRRHVWFWRGVWYDAVEHFFLARSHAFTPPVYDEPPRWWTLDAIRQHQALFAPRALATLLAPILRGDIPRAPIAVGR